MEFLKEKVENCLNKILGLSSKEKITLKFNQDLEFGDFYSPYLMERKFENKKEEAEKLISKINRYKSLRKIFSKIEYKEPGFLNFFLSKDVLFEEGRFLLEASFPLKKREEKIIIEFISANPTGPLTLGNARGGFLGDSLARLLKKSGFETFSEYFINNAKNSKQIIELGKTFLGKGESYLTDYLRKIIEELKKSLKTEDPKEAGFRLAEVIQKDNQKFIENVLRIKFDNWFSEQSLYETSKIEKTFQLLKNRNLVYKKDGAFYLKTSEFSDSEDRVIVRSDGTPTYFLSDIAYHLTKFERGFNRVINIWGADHFSHIKRMESALKGLDILDGKNKFEVIVVQLVSLKRKGQKEKMSKRKGIYMTLAELVGLVGLDVAKFFFLEKAPQTHLEFDLDLALEQSKKNPVFYLQYGWVRSLSIFKKVGKPPTDLKKLSFLEEPEEINLLRLIVRFPSFLESILTDYSVHKLTTYALDITRLFSVFYEKINIKDSNQNLKEARLLLVYLYQKVLKECLEILGISLPEKM